MRIEHQGFPENIGTQFISNQAKHTMATGQGTAGNVIAALANVFVPGLGQLLQGRLLPAILFFILIVTGYALWFLLIPAILAGLLHLWCILDAAIWKPR